MQLLRRIPQSLVWFKRTAGISARIPERCLSQCYRLEMRCCFVQISSSHHGQAITKFPTNSALISFIPKRRITRKSPHDRVGQFQPQHEKDNVPKDYTLVYQRTMAYSTMLGFAFKVAVVHMAWLSVSCLLYAVTDSLYLRATLPILGEMNELMLMLGSVTMCIAGVIAFHVIRFNRMAVVRIYHHEKADKYIAVLVQGLKGQKNVEFTLGDVVRTQRRRQIAHGNALLHGQKIALYCDDFVSLSYFNKMLGYDDDALQQKKEE